MISDMVESFNATNTACLRVQDPIQEPNPGRRINDTKSVAIIQTENNKGAD